MTTIISLQGPLNAQQTSLLERAQQIRQRAESVKSSLLAAPSDSVHLNLQDCNEGLGIYSYSGQIGNDGYARAEATLQEGQLEAFAAHSQAGETLKFHLTTSQATGLRAGIAGALGAVGGGLGQAAAWLLAKAITNHGQSPVQATLLEWSSRPLSLGSDLARLAERKVADPGTRDEYYALASPNGDYEQFRFTASNTLEHDYFPATRA